MCMPVRHAPPQKPDGHPGAPRRQAGLAHRWTRVEHRPRERSLMYTLARVVRLATTVAVAIVVAGILIHVLGANTSNGIISAINDAAKWLVQPFDNVFHLNSHKATIALNWGIAAVVYAIVGGVISRALARSAVVGGTRRGLPRRPAL